MKKKKKMIEQWLLTRNELAEYLDITPQRVSQLCDSGVLEHDEAGLYDLQFSIISYGRFILAPQLYR
jgi:hypothetical protein